MSLLRHIGLKNITQLSRFEVKSIDLDRYGWYNNELSSITVFVKSVTRLPHHLKSEINNTIRVGRDNLRCPIQDSISP